ncbi:hypothetical protein EUTSA_v10000510mg [Eutrema salsugineum]|uniref:C-JID domain-containing protein n=1 Tax=Eutrema salsugineum TaxID=72664 RepID=V4L8D6_EUTSA|nr:hypothetical protein EUTSA_v10000510mg [Eutrema salsugineum]
MECRSLVEIPSSCSHLHKLQKLDMENCYNLKIIPAHMNLASLESVSMMGCSRLRQLPVISTNITKLLVSEADVKEVPASIRLCSRLQRLTIRNSHNFKAITYIPTSVTHLELSNTGIEKIPDCIKALHRLQYPFLFSCKRLISLPELPGSLVFLLAEDCESLETVFFPLNTSHMQLYFNNCFKLGEQTRRAIIQQSVANGNACLPGREVPREFDHRARGNSLTIPLNGNRALSPYTRFSVCLVVSVKHQTEGGMIFCTIVKDNLDPIYQTVYLLSCRTDHLFIFDTCFRDFEDYIEESGEKIVFEFRSDSRDLNVIECGIQSYESEYIEEEEEEEEDNDSVTSGSYYTESSEGFED